MNLVEIFSQAKAVSENEAILTKGEILDFTVYEEQKKIEVTVLFPEIISKNLIFTIAKSIREAYQLSVIKLYTRYPEALFSDTYYPELLTYISLKMPGVRQFLENSSATYQNQILTIQLSGTGADLLSHNGAGEEMKKLIQEEFSLEIDIIFADGITEPRTDNFLEKRAEYIRETVASEMEETIRDLSEKKKSPIVMGKEIKGEAVPISSLTAESGRVVILGSVFYLEERETRNGFMALNMDVTDGSSSITVKKLFTKEEYSAFSSKVKVGTCVKIRGETMYDKYLRDYVINPYDISLEEKEIRQDNSEEKRIELHMHTKMSAVDGVSDVQTLIDAAAKWGHKAIAITDHGVLQAYPEAYLHVKKKKLDIKLLFGVECYLLDDLADIYHGEDAPLNTEFVVFDLETTGLAPQTERITEIGAVKIKDGKVIDRFSEFVNPKKNLTPEISNLTGITDAMLAGKPDETDVIPRFMEFVGNAVLVAHNASFDMSFLDAACERLGIYQDRKYLDTLDLARRIFPDLKNHKLDTLAKETHVVLEGHHRAVNDAEALFGIFLVLLEKVSEQGISSLSEMNTKLTKNTDTLRPYHGIILVKNKEGLLNLYKLVTNSNLLHFKKRPRMLKSELQQMHNGLIYGSACEAGELYGAIKSGAKQSTIEKIASFYDFLEVQPLGNNEFMLESGQYTQADLIRFNKEIIALGKKLGKPVVATGDVHFLNPEDSAYRKILMYGHGFKDADKQAPLYLRTTQEMLDEFWYLDEETKREIVITNPNLISDMCDDEIVPIPKEKHPPVIPGAEDELRQMTYDRAKQIYGDDLPELVKERMDKELNSIITNGFSVMYIIAQKLVKKSLQDGYLVGSRGSVGSSFVAFLSGITEVNALCAHYICENPDCKYSEFFTNGEYNSGYDMPEKTCPNCGRRLKQDGHDIPFETFLGFNGDKEPDIDLNFSGDYQPIIHKYCEEIFGEGHVFRAGTISTIAEKNAMGYVRKYVEENNLQVHSAEMRRLAMGCEGVKKTTGQHPGGVMIVPKENEVFEFCPIAHPADDSESDIITTHFAYTYLHDCLLKLDLLGHDDPTMIRMLKDLTGLDPQTIPLEDKATMSLFTGTEALGVTPDDINSTVGTFGVPEFGTKFVRQMLVDTKPTTFSELVRISGLSHGTDVWLNNAQDLINSGTATLKEAICTRDDIMTYLIYKNLPPKTAFTIMESVRKGKGLNDEWEAIMREHDVPEWYIDSCKKIKYMFPKAHAVAYVTMAFRIAYYKVHHPLAYYATYFSVRADDFDADIMVGDRVIPKIKEYESIGADANAKEKNILTILEMCNEMQKRGFSFLPVDLYKSDATKFLIEENALRMPFTAMKGLGATAAETIVAAREEEPFFSKDDLLTRTKISKTILEQMDQMGCTAGLPDSSQVGIFDLL
ncbi:MAG: PolC-type DNA polymerase III [Clostridia bacterium]|nr:PolC-type DNA polymerase III [Clostridia bacterium]